MRAGRPAPELSRFFYRAVGGDWYWLDRLDWTYDQWLAWVERPGPRAVDLLGRRRARGLRRARPLVERLARRGRLLRPAARVRRSRPRRLAAHPRDRARLGGRGHRGCGCTRASSTRPPALANYRARGFAPCGPRPSYWDTRALARAPGAAAAEAQLGLARRCEKLKSSTSSGGIDGAVEVVAHLAGQGRHRRAGVRDAARAARPGSR